MGVELPGYTILQQIHEGIQSSVYRGTRNQDKKPVVIKLLKSDYCSPDTVASFKREYELTHSLDKDGTVEAYGIEKYENNVAIIFEDFGTSTLYELLLQRRLSVMNVLTIAIQIVEALEKIHNHSIIHKDINPYNILWDATTSQIKIIDFGISSTLTREQPEVQSFLKLEGMLSYISPEQTGRMNRPIDYRSDYYSLGVVFYQMLTGKLPFDSSDPLELVHHHIALVPPAPHTIRSEAPEILSKIILKLMAKEAENRYQSLYGLKHDLVNCINQLKTTGVIEEFAIASQDVSSRFSISEKFYGREVEMQTLLKSLQHTCEGASEVVLVVGDSGTGKSRLVHEMNKFISEKKGYFIFDKFDQFKRNIPFAILTHAFQNFVKQIQGESDEKIEIWRNQILNGVGKNCQILLKVIPSLEAIIGSQPPAPELTPVETENRFNLAFQKFIQVIATSEHPLVIFLDDLQWADLSSLKLIESLFKSHDMHYLLLLGSYRENEIDAMHPLIPTLEAIHKALVNVSTITLKPLTTADVEHLIADTLHQQLQQIKRLAEICFEKTNGNPFFLNQFLQELYHEKIIEFDHKQGQWTWDVYQIQQKGFTNNVIEFMAKKVRMLPAETQNVLKLAASLGNRFDIQTLTIIAKKSAKEVTKDLWPALEQSFVVPSDDAYKYIDDSPTQNANYHFLHDQVQQAAYDLIDKKVLAEIHLEIARLLLKNTQKEKLDENILLIVNHFNQGIHLVDNAAEREIIAELNLQSGQKARMSAAYQAAFTYFQTGISLLPQNSWENVYRLTLDLYTEASEAAYLVKKIGLMKQYVDLVISKARKALDKSKVIQIKILYFTGRNQHKKAVHFAVQQLKSFGVKIPEVPTKLGIILAFLRCRWLLLGKHEQALNDLPTMKNPHSKAIIKILMAMHISGFTIDPRFIVIIGLKSLELTLKYGATEDAGVAFFSYAFILAYMGKFKLRNQYAQIGLNLTKRAELVKENPVITAIYETFLDDNLRHGIAVCPALFQKMIENGYMAFAGQSISNYISKLLPSGMPAPNICKELEKYVPFLLKTGQENAFLLTVPWWRFVLAIAGRDDKEIIDLVGPRGREENIIESAIKNKNKLVLFSLYNTKSLHQYRLGNYEEAYSLICKSISNGILLRGMPNEPIFHSRLVLIALGYYDQAPKKEKSKILKIVRASLRTLKNWASISPADYAHNYYLSMAEYARVYKKNDKAIVNYDLSIKFAHNSGFLYDEALANELTAKFYLQLGKEKIAQTYLLYAYYANTRAGAEFHNQQLQANFPELLQDVRALKQLSPTERSLSISSLSPKLGADFLDLSTILKSAQTISKDLMFSDLLKNMMHIVIENAGAEKGFLLLEKEGKWVIEAEESINSQAKVLQSTPIEERLPQSIIRYVSHSKMPITDENLETQFANDPYIINVKPKSVLCLPLLNQGELHAILYLENNLITHAFTQERMAVLSLLSGQIVTSMNNARLYTNTIELNELLSATNKKLSDTNKAYAQFVPQEFLSLLGKEKITDVVVGDHIQKDMTIMFLDIRDFTSLSEKMTPDENFLFINQFLNMVTPIVAFHHGFIDKFLGDGLMALFPTNADNAVLTALSILRSLEAYNRKRDQQKYDKIRIGIGLNSGLLMLGTVGGEKRMDGTVISDVVNVTSRVENLTKIYGAPLLITDETYSRLRDPSCFAIRKIEKEVIVKGKSKPIVIYEVFDEDPPEMKELKIQTVNTFEQGIKLFHQRRFKESLDIFKEVLHINKDDLPAQYCAMRCIEMLNLKEQVEQYNHNL